MMFLQLSYFSLHGTLKADVPFTNKSKKTLKYVQVVTSHRSFH